MHVELITKRFTCYNKQHLQTMYICILRYRSLNVVYVVQAADSNNQETCDG